MAYNDYINQLVLDFLACTNHEIEAIEFQNQCSDLIIDRGLCTLRIELRKLLSSHDFSKIIDLVLENIPPTSKRASVIINLHLARILNLQTPIEQTVSEIKSHCIPLLNTLSPHEQNVSKNLMDRAMVYLLKPELEPQLESDLNLVVELHNLTTSEREREGRDIFKKIAAIGDFLD